MNTVELTDEQKAAKNFVLTNCMNENELLAVDGPAGSGKTTLLKDTVSELEHAAMQPRVVATTGKAADVLRRKGLQATTIHSACMKPLFKPPLDVLGAVLEQAQEPDANLEKIQIPKSLQKDYKPDQILHALSMAKTAGIYAAMRSLGIRDVMSYIERWLPAAPQPGVLIVDEASMLGEIDLSTISKVYRKIVLVGDEFQLMPVKSRPVFWLVPKRVHLTQIHRQAEGSQPLQLATQLRQGGTVTPTNIQPVSAEISRAGNPVIVWKNATRVSLTTQIRKQLGLGGSPPQSGEVLICRNSSDRQAKGRGLINNTIWKVLESNGYSCTLENYDGDILEGESCLMEETQQGHGTLFRFGYCLTAHSAQGSEFDHVQINVPDCRDMFGFKREEATRFLYTAITRAKQQVHWVNNTVAA
jgi:exodeoxyribonuclease-5